MENILDKLLMTRILLVLCIVFQLLACQSSYTPIYGLVDLRKEKITYGTQEDISRLHRDRIKAQTDGQIIPIKTPFPAYPKKLLDAGIEGVVVVDFIVNKKGKVVQPVIVQSRGEEFDKASLACIKRWRFEPVLKDGKPIDARLRQEFQFKTE